jgi:tyrosine-protein phosphatase non-receptor type 23
MFSLVDINLLLRPHFSLQELVDRCAALSAKPNTIQNLVDAMSKLADTYHDVEGMLQDIKELIQVYSFCLSDVYKNVTLLSLLP